MPIFHTNRLHCVAQIPHKFEILLARSRDVQIIILETFGKIERLDH